MIEQQIRNSTESSPIVQLLTAIAVASILGISPKTVHKLVREKKLACVQVTARDRRFTLEQIQEFIQSQTASVRVDKTVPRPVKSPLKKGGDRAKSSGVFSRQALLEEMRKCR